MCYRVFGWVTLAAPYTEVTWSYVCMCVTKRSVVEKAVENSLQQRQLNGYQLRVVYELQLYIYGEWLNFAANCSSSWFLLLHCICTVVAHFVRTYGRAHITKARSWMIDKKVRSYVCIVVCIYNWMKFCQVNKRNETQSHSILISCLTYSRMQHTRALIHNPYLNGSWDEWRYFEWNR